MIFKSKKIGTKERRRYPRVMVPVLFRAPRISRAKQRVSNLSFGGVRIYSDKRLKYGQSLELEFFLPDGSTVEAVAMVVWVKEMPPEAEALYDVGLEFVDLSKATKEQLNTVLSQKL